MARKKQLAAASRKQALCDELAASRLTLTHGKDLLKGNLNVKEQLSKKILGRSKALGSKGFAPLNLLGLIKSDGALSKFSGLHQTLGNMDRQKLIFGSALLGVVTLSVLSRKRRSKEMVDTDSENKGQRREKRRGFSLKSFFIGIALKQIRKSATKMVTKKVASHLKGKLIEKVAHSSR